MTTALPEHVRLLHVGPPKTGTTALQVALAERRRVLLDHGVRYPGTGDDHGMAVAAFVGQRWGWGGAGSSVPPAAHWSALKAEVDGERRRRVLLGHEYAAKADEPQIGRFAAELGPRLVAAITLRDPAAMLPSIWQESLKLGGTTPFDEFLQRNLLRSGPDGADHPARNQALLVERWARVLGPERVVVVVVDRSRPDSLFTGFEQLLDLPPGLLGSGAGRGRNRGLTRDEAAVLLELNEAARAAGMRWDDYSSLIGRGAIRALLERRVPPMDEPRVMLPPWAGRVVRERAEDWRERIEATGVRVVGDLAALVPQDAESAPADDDGRADRDVAVIALAGLAAVTTAQGRDVPRTRLAAVDPREHLVVRNVGIAGLARVVASRTLRRGGKALRIAAASVTPRRRPR